MASSKLLVIWIIQRRKIRDLRFAQRLMKIYSMMVIDGESMVRNPSRTACIPGKSSWNCLQKKDLCFSHLWSYEIGILKRDKSKGVIIDAHKTCVTWRSKFRGCRRRRALWRQLMKESITILARSSCKP